MDAEMEEKRSKVEDEEVTKGEMEEEQEVQALIKKLSEKQKLAIQEHIIDKQRQVLQGIPYNELSSKQKEILAKLSRDTASSTVTTQGSDATNPTRYVTLKAGQVLTPEALQPVKPSIQIMRKVVAQPVQVIQITADDNFSEENIAAEIEVKAPSPVRTGPLRVKAFAKSLLKFANVIKAAEASVSAGPRATVKESCPICKKIFSKSGLEGHIEAKHWISCSKCDKRFPVGQLEMHMKRDHELPRVPCAVCGKVVFSQVSFSFFPLSIFDQSGVTVLAGACTTHGYLPQHRMRNLQHEDRQRGV